MHSAQLIYLRCVRTDNKKSDNVLCLLQGTKTGQEAADTDQILTFLWPMLISLLSVGVGRIKAEEIIELPEY